mmetsp:Transcript_40959/g.80143  ORF Transcript_40959/g.80143 Transcript_40959/m.80143 type:complete len:221 (-) Transcript_40959:20-682(-)
MTQLTSLVSLLKIIVATAALLSGGSDAFLIRSLHSSPVVSVWKRTSLSAWDKHGRRRPRRPIERDNAGSGGLGSDDGILRLPGSTGGIPAENEVKGFTGGDGADAPSNPPPSDEGETQAAIGFVGSSKLRLRFTCNLCDGRSTYEVSRVAYREGLVICQCKFCEANHLIADHTDLSSGGFDGAGNIEEFFRMTDRAVNRVSKDVWALEDIYDLPFTREEE